jgi:hypothetical protein
MIRAAEPPAAGRIHRFSLLASALVAVASAGYYFSDSVPSSRVGQAEILDRGVHSPATGKPV